MLEFAVDCFLAGTAVGLFILTTQAFLRSRGLSVDFLWYAAGYGIAIYLSARFLLSFWIMWNTWE